MLQKPLKALASPRGLLREHEYENKYCYVFVNAMTKYTIIVPAKERTPHNAANGYTYLRVDRWSHGNLLGRQQPGTARTMHHMHRSSGEACHQPFSKSPELGLVVLVNQ